MSRERHFFVWRNTQKNVKSLKLRDGVLRLLKSNTEIQDFDPTKILMTKRASKWCL